MTDSADVSHKTDKIPDKTDVTDKTDAADVTAVADKVFLGIDTSCYTTSIAFAVNGGKPLYERRRTLRVPAGKRGLRQSEAFFQHMRNLPALFREMAESLGYAPAERLGAVAVSAKPCRRDDSYMPVFLAGFGVAQALASVAGVPLVETTHQESHLMAALWSAGVKAGESACPFLAFHLSGGTTELLLVKHIRRETSFSFDCESLSGTLDIPAGQLVDRTGQILGLPFPAGPELEKTALSLGAEALPKERIPTRCRQGWLSFSGGEAWAKRALAAGGAKAEIARTVEHYIAGSLIKAVRAFLEKAPEEKASEEKASGEKASGEKAPGENGGNTGQEEGGGAKFVLFMGGVAANAYIRRRLEHDLGRALPCVFAQPAYCGDNAYGTALIGAASAASTALAPG